MTRALMSTEFSLTLKGEDLNKKSARNAHVNMLAENDSSDLISNFLSYLGLVIKF